MDIIITPSKLNGHVDIPSSKSYSHRYVIAAALADGISEISGVTASKDIDVTCAAMERLGAKISAENGVYTINGISKAAHSADIDCGESGSTLRFMIPVAAALGAETVFRGHGKLPERPYSPYVRELSAKGISFDCDSGLPLGINGRLQAGEYTLEGDISSQFITGLLYALPLCDGDSVVRLSTPLQSKPYVDMTISTLNKFGIEVRESSVNDLPVYLIKGGQSYRPASARVEGDYSQAAFFFAANAMGSSIDIGNLVPGTSQGDKAIVDIIRDNTSDGVLHGFTADAGDIPDLVPILSVLGCVASGTTRIVNAARLRIKESDRLVSTAAMLNAIGGRVTVGDDYLLIEHTDHFTGGEVDACNDHRIVMAAAIAATASSAPVTIHGAEAVTKSYPGFFRDFAALGGIVSSDNTLI